MQGAARDRAVRTQRSPTARPGASRPRASLHASRTLRHRVNRAGYGRRVSTGGDFDGTAPAIEVALAAYLAFRTADMDLWRRAGLVARLSHSTMLALTLILRADAAGEPLRQVAVQTALRISPAGTSAIVTELVGRGLVRRTADPADGRAILLVAGEAAPFVTAQLQQHDDEFRALVAELPAEHLRTLVHVLDGMRERGEQKYLDA